MGLIHIDLFTTLDGVAQAPGGPEEDPHGGFTFGGWQAPLIDELVGEQVEAGMAQMDALLLGRRTYDIFAGYWPNVHEGAIAERFNRLPKYVASRQPRVLEWANSVQLGAHSAPSAGFATGADLDVADRSDANTIAAVRHLREAYNDIHVIGSLDFAQTLISAKLFDMLTLWVYPILLGQGKKVFADGVVPTSLKLLEPAVTSPSGAVMLRYMRTVEPPHVGNMAAG